MRNKVRSSTSSECCVEVFGIYLRRSCLQKKQNSGKGSKLYSYFMNSKTSIDRNFNWNKIWFKRTHQKSHELRADKSCNFSSWRRKRLGCWGKTLLWLPFCVFSCKSRPRTSENYWGRCWADEGLSFKILSVIFINCLSERENIVKYILIDDLRLFI